MQIIDAFLVLAFLGLLAIANYFLFKAWRNLSDEGKRQKWTVLFISKWFAGGDMFTGKGLEYREKSFLVYALAVVDLVMFILIHSLTRHP